MALQFTWTPTISCFSINLDPHELQGGQPQNPGPDQDLLIFRTGVSFPIAQPDRMKGK